jgi:hypothetical protein
LFVRGNGFNGRDEASRARRVHNPLTLLIF